MFKRFFTKSQGPSAVELTLKGRMELFWKWFSEESSTYYQAIESGDFNSHASEFSEKIHGFLPGVAWVFGPGADGVGHSLTLSPEGDAYAALVITHIIKNAPTLDGWTFYDSRQASPTFDGMSMDIAGENVSAKQIWITPSIDEEREKIDVTCWAPVFVQLDEGARGQITFLWLDETLGEFQVGSRLGAIDIEPSNLENAIPLSELPEFVHETELACQWERRTPGEYYTGYNLQERADYEPEFLRSDIFTGTSLLYEIACDYAREQGSLDHPLPKLGVDFVFVALPWELFDQEKQVDERTDIEDKLTGGFDINGSGIVLGGAAGRKNMYIEIAILDGERGISTLLEVLKGDRIGQHGAVHYFDKERVEHEVVA